MTSVSEAGKAYWEKVKAEADAARSISEPPSTTGGGGGTYGPMEARVKKLEDDMTDIKVMLGRIDERLGNMDRQLVTKADIAETERRLGDRIGAVETKVGKVEGALESKLNVWQFITYGLGIGALTVAAIGLVVRWPGIAAAVSAGTQ